MKSESHSKTFCARLTPVGRGAVAVIALQGPDAETVLDRLFHPINGKTYSQTSPRKIIYGIWEPTKEDLVILRRENLNFEIHCHGGNSAPSAILASLADLKISEKPAVEFLTGHGDAWTVSVESALAKAPTERTARIILNQLALLPTTIKNVVELIRSGQTEIAVSRIDSLLTSSQLSKHLLKPRSIVLCGQPNVGKSSLVNAIVGFQRAIVHDAAGTTRDVVSQRSAINGWPVELKDTAGLRESTNDIEAKGIEKAKTQIQISDLKVCAFDLSSRWSEEDQNLLDEIGPDVIVHNKADLVDTSGDSDERPDGIMTSVESGVGIEDLIGKLGTYLELELPATKPCLVSESQFDCLEKALETIQTRSDFDQSEIVESILSAGLTRD
ncbi:MAG: GTPase [Mariniblastus sp.]